MPDEIEALWQQGIAWLTAEGATVRDISLPHTKYALPAYYIVAPAEASSNLARYDGVKYGLRVTGKDITDLYELTRAAGFGREVKRRVMIGTYVLSAGYYDAYYVQAQKVRTLIKRDFEIAFNDGIDAILTPATPSAAFGVGDEDMKADPVKMYLNDVFTVTVNMAGLPGIAVPAGKDCAGPAARAAAHRQAVRRGDAVRRRAGHRAQRRDGLFADALVVTLERITHDEAVRLVAAGDVIEDRDLADVRWRELPVPEVRLKGLPARRWRSGRSRTRRCQLCGLHLPALQLCLRDAVRLAVAALHPVRPKSGSRMPVCARRSRRRAVRGLQSLDVQF